MSDKREDLKRRLLEVLKEDELPLISKARVLDSLADLHWDWHLDERVRRRIARVEEKIS